MKRGGTKNGRLFELATVLAERLSVTELYLGGLAVSCCCAYGLRALLVSVTLAVNGFIFQFYSSPTFKLLIDLLVITVVSDFNSGAV